MIPQELLSEFRLNSLPVLLYGWGKGWLPKQSIVQWAIEQLEELSKSERTVDSSVELSLARLAGGEVENKRLIEQVVNAYVKMSERSIAYSEENFLDIWRLVQILSLLQSSDTKESKVCKLQELYAEYGYPSDMSSISIYTNDGVSPLAAAEHLARKLAMQLEVNRFDLFAFTNNQF